MTNEKAIDLLRRMQEPEPYEPQITEEAFEALELAIRVLGTDKNVGTTDTISRKAALNEILGQPPELHYPSWYADQIRQLPPIQPRREDGKIGEWIYDWGDWDFETCKCSECGNHSRTEIGKRYNFCPYCGAKMGVTT